MALSLLALAVSKATQATDHFKWLCSEMQFNTNEMQLSTNVAQNQATPAQLQACKPKLLLSVLHWRRFGCPRSLTCYNFQTALTRYVEEQTSNPRPVYTVYLKGRFQPIYEEIRVQRCCITVGAACVNPVHTVKASSVWILNSCG